MQTYKPSLQRIKEEYQQMIELTIKWSLLNSWSDNVEGLDRMLDILIQDFAILKGENTTISFSPRLMTNSKGDRIEKPLGKALSIKKRKTAPIQIFLAGHMDTVYPPSHPFPIIKKGKEIVNGPGVTDMKGGLVVLLKTLEALEQSPFADRIGWELFINPDEEIGSPGSYSYFIEAAKRYQIGMIFEPSLPDGSFVSHRKGTANYTLIVRGTSAHAGRDFFSGQSAIYGMAFIIGELEKLSQAEKHITVNVGHIEGGGAVNIVPDLAICKINIRANESEEMKKTSDHMHLIIHQVNQKGFLRCSLIEDTFRLPKSFDTKTQNLFKLYEDCAHLLDLPFTLKPSGGACDGNILSAAGLPTIDSLGVMGGHLHTTDEFIWLPSLVQKTELASLFLFRISTGELSLEELHHA